MKMAEHFQRRAHLQTRFPLCLQAQWAAYSSLKSFLRVTRLKILIVAFCQLNAEASRFPMRLKRSSFVLELSQLRRCYPAKWIIM